MTVRPEFGTKIVAAAILHEGTIHTLPPPARHHTIMEMMFELGIHNSPTTTQGFVTDTGRFIRRKPAARLARQHGQIGLAKRTDPQDTLFSEDLW